MVDAIIKELILQKEYLKAEKVETIYFGGGTPSLLSGREIGSILDVIYDFYDVIHTPEVTLEANPDDLSKQKLIELYHSGINRLSIGIQSFSDRVLKYLNRAHTAEEALASLNNAIEVGFNNLSIDLIYGIPGRDEVQWIEDLKKATLLSPTHISAYSLTVEPQTVFGKWSKQNKFPPLDDDQAARQFEIMLDHLKENSFEQYEISNFCIPGFHSKHNTSYWQQKKYLGIGPSAHSYDGVSRQYNISKNAVYIKSVNNRTIPATKEKLTVSDQVNEYLLTTLRTKWGSNMKMLKQKYEIDILRKQGDYISQLRANSYVQIENEHIVLTDKGKLFADQISADLFV